MSKTAILVAVAVGATATPAYTPYDPNRYHSASVLGLDATQVGDATMVAVRFNGTIEERSDLDIRKAIADTLDRGQVIAYLEITSHGGSGEGGRRLGRMLQSYPSLPILVVNECSSACANGVLTAGTRRIVMGPYGRIGVHQSHVPGSWRPVDWASQNAATRLREAGVPVSVVRGLLRTPPESIYWLKESELAQMGVMGRYVVK